MTGHPERGRRGDRVEGPAFAISPPQKAPVRHTARAQKQKSRDRSRLLLFHRSYRALLLRLRRRQRVEQYRKTKQKQKKESGGIGIKGHLPERDGILNSLLLAEVMAQKRKTLGELVEELTQEFGPHFYGRIDLEVELSKAQQLVKLVAQGKFKKIAGLKVTAVEDLDGAKMRFGDSAWLLVRASGTENLLRLYSEAPSREQVRLLLEEMKRIATAK